MQAVRILQDYLDDIAAAVMSGDYPRYRDGVVLPLHLVTHTTNLSVTTEDGLRNGFDAFRLMLRTQRVTDYIRLVESAQAIDEELISGRYVTHLIAGGMRVNDPFQSQITLRREAGRWRAASITNALSNSRWPLVMPSLANTDPLKGPEQ